MTRSLTRARLYRCAKGRTDRPRKRAEKKKNFLARSRFSPSSGFTNDKSTKQFSRGRCSSLSKEWWSNPRQTCLHEVHGMNDERMWRTLKRALDDGSIQEIEYETPIDHYDLLRMIYHDLKYDRLYDWEKFYYSTSFIRTDNGIETSSIPLNHSSSDTTVYELVLPPVQSNPLTRLFSFFFRF